MSKLNPRLYTVAWIAPLEIEARAALHMLNKRHSGQFPMDQGDEYVFIAGEMCNHNVIIATLPPGQEYGAGSAAALASQVKKFFSNLWFGLLVGVAAGLPDHSRNPPRDIRLGDVLVALPDGESAGLVAYDLGKETGDGFQPLRFGHVLANTETVVRSAIGSIKLSWPADGDVFLPYYEEMKDKEHPDGNFMDPGQDQDQLYEYDKHGAEILVQRPQRPDSRRTRVWYGPIGSGEKLIKNARKRNELRDRYNVIGLEMEAVGIMNRIPVGVIRGVCDYGDEHENKEWQPYAAAMAAAYAKAILHKILPRKIADSAEKGESMAPPISFGERNTGLLVGINYGTITAQILDQPHRHVFETEFNELMEHKIREWMKPPSYEKDLENTFSPQKKNKSLSKWILKHSKYLDWLNGDMGRLWIRGRPGCGKSVLAAIIVRDLLRRRNTEAPEGEGELAEAHIGFVFCRDETKKDSIAILKILLCQILSRGSSLRQEQKANLMSWYAMSSSEEMQADTSGVAKGRLMKVLSLVLRPFRRVYLLIDGLDECSEPEQIVKDILSLSYEHSQSDDHLHTLFVSQKTSQITNQIEPTFQSIDLDSHELRRNSHRDIGIAIMGILSDSEDPAIIAHCDKLKDIIVDKCEGMILWATLAARRLLAVTPSLQDREVSTLESISNLIESLPTDMESFYAHLLERCFPPGQSADNHTNTLTILQWSLWSTRPVHIEELQIAMNVSQPQNTHKERSTACHVKIDRLRFQISTLCYPLISIQEDDTILIVHASFRDFIQQRKGINSTTSESIISALSEDRASLNMLKVCLGYLNESQFQQFQNLVEDIAESVHFDTRYRLFDYAALSWIQHWRTCSLSQRTDPTVLNLFNNLIRREQGLTWLEGFRARSNMSLQGLAGLQAEVNDFTGSSVSQKWMMDLLEVMLQKKQDIFGDMKKPATRLTAIALASMYSKSGRATEAKDLFARIVLDLESHNEESKYGFVDRGNLALAQADVGDYKEAEINLKQILQSRQEIYGQGNILTTTVKNSLATLYMNMGQWQNSERLLKEVVRIRIKELGEYDPDTIVAKNNLAQTYHNLGKLEEAKAIFIDLIQNMPQQKGDEQLSALLIKHNLAAIYNRLGEYEEAEKLGKEVLELRTTFFGKAHLDTIKTLNNLAYTYKSQSRYREAENLLREGFKRSESTLGPSHLSTLVMQQNLAEVLSRLRQYEDSRSMHTNVYEERKRILGPTHPDTLSSLSHSAGLGCDLGKFDEAEEQFAQVAQAYSSLYGPDHTSTLDVLSGLALTCHQRGRYAMSAELITRVLKRRRKILGQSHPATIFSLVVLGLYKGQLGLWDEAIDSLGKALDLGAKIWKPDHEHNLSCRRIMAQNYRRRGQAQQAQDILFPVLEQYNVAFGDDHPDTALARMELALAHFDMGQLGQSLVLVKKLLDNPSKPTHQLKHPTILAVKRLLGRIYHAQGRLQLAEELLHGTLEQQKQYWGDTHPFTMETNRSLALVLRDKGNIAQAESQLLQLVDQSINNMGLVHPDTLSSIENLGMIYNIQRRHSEALELMDVILRARKQFLGQQHPEYLRTEEKIAAILMDAQKPAQITRRLLDIVPVWNAAGPDSRNLVDAIKSSSEEDYQHWVLIRSARDMDCVLGEDHWESIESRRQLAVYELGHGKYVRATKPLRKAWQKHKEVLGASNTETLTTLLELCECWKALGTLSKKLTSEAPHILSWAVKAKHEALFEFLLREKIDLDQKDEQGTPLLHAVKLDFASMVRRLLEAGASTKWASGSPTPLHVAASLNRPLVLGFLLKHGADINALCPDGHTALYYASREGNSAVVDKLLQSDPKPTVDLAGPSTMLPLHAAVYGGHLEIIKTMLVAGANIETACFGKTPVQVATTFGRDEALRILLSHGASASPSEDGERPIHVSAQKGTRNILTMLLDAKVDVNCPDSRGLTPLHWAAANGHILIMDDLLAHGAFVDVKSYSGTTALQLAATKGQVKAMQRLIESGADLSNTTNSGLTALHFASSNDSLEAVEFLIDFYRESLVCHSLPGLVYEGVWSRNPTIVSRLIEAGADPNDRSPKGYSALDAAVASKQVDMLDLLLQNGAHPELCDRHGITPLHRAAHEGDLEIVVRLMRESSVQVNKQSIYGLTPLHLAATAGKRDVAASLLDQGADANLVDRLNTTALSYATQKHWDEVVAILLPHTQNPLLLDGFGKSSLEWAHAVSSTFKRMGKWGNSFSLTSDSVQKSHVTQSIVTLSTDLLTTRVENDPRFTTLGRLLLVMGENAQATHAFQLLACKGSKEGLLEYNITCDLCNAEANIKGDLFVCLECASRHLCSKCMTSYIAGTAELNGCVGHKFYLVTGRAWQGAYESSTGLVNLLGQSLDEWLETVRSPYDKEGAFDPILVNS